MLIKTPDDYSKRLRLLQELRESPHLDAKQKAWLRDEYWRLAPGLAGERDAAHYLDMSFSESKNHAILHDLRLEADGDTAQIDHLVVDRMLHFFLLETKTYRGNLHINEHGEFMVEYPGERRYGIESPLEQSRRHEKVLKKVLERAGIVGRAGLPPKFVHVVMVHPKAIIHRPPAKAFDTSMVIKADQFKTWHDKHIDAWGVGKVFAGMLNVHGRDTVAEWGMRLKAEHRPQNPLALPDFLKPKPAATTETAPRPAAPMAADIPAPAPEPVRPRAPSGAADAPVCAACGKALTPKVADFCQKNAKRFGGKLYCYDHQADARKATA